MARHLKIAVLWRPGRNVEWQNRYLGTTIPDDALEEATLHRDGLIEAGHDAQLVRWRQDDLAGMLEELGGGRFDLVFNASSLAEVAFLEAAGIPYCGSGLDLVALDKAARKKILVYHGIPTAPFFVVDDGSRATGGVVPLTELKNGWRPPEPLSYPLFVKPVRGRGSSGISDESIVHDHDELVRQVEKIITRLDQGALVERYVQGREVTVGLIGERPVVLTPLEIEYNQVKTNTYEHKMDREIFHCPARFDDEVLERLKETALETFKALGARDYGRVDMMVDDRGQPTVLELNTFAGLQIVTGREEHLHASYIGEMARAMGMSRSELLGTIVESAARRLPTPTRPARADRPALTAHMPPAAPPATNGASPEPG